MFANLLSIVTAVAYRLRGGGFVHTGRTNLFARPAWAITVGLLFWYIGIPAYLAVVAAVGAFLSLIAVGHSEFQDGDTMPRGYSKDGDKYETLFGLIKFTQPNDFRGNLIVGFFRGLFIFGALIVVSPVWAAAIVGNALIYASAYYVAWKWFPHSTGKIWFFSNPEGSVYNAEYAELIYGFLFGLMVVCLA